jgi:hypothetical protein
MAILLMTIGGYYINDYWWIYFVSGYLWLLMVIILVVIGGYFISGY